MASQKKYLIVRLALLATLPRLESVSSDTAITLQHEPRRSLAKEERCFWLSE